MAFPQIKYIKNKTQNNTQKKQTVPFYIQIPYSKSYNATCATMLTSSILFRHDRFYTFNLFKPETNSTRPVFLVVKSFSSMTHNLLSPKANLYDTNNQFIGIH